MSAAASTRMGRLRAVKRYVTLVVEVLFKLRVLYTHKETEPYIQDMCNIEEGQAASEKASKAQAEPHPFRGGPARPGGLIFPIPPAGRYSPPVLGLGLALVLVLLLLALLKSGARGPVEELR